MGLIFLPDLIKIPAGISIIGSNLTLINHFLSEWKQEFPKARLEYLLSETPQHKVFINEFHIGKYPITNYQFSEFIKSTEYTPKHADHIKLLSKEFSNHPVSGILFEDAHNYCLWLSSITNLDFRLPTEIEWERASRGEDDRIYPWGNTWHKNACNNLELGLDGTTEIGKFSPLGDSAFGCVDMVGNVWEWTRSCWGSEKWDAPGFYYPYVSNDGREDCDIISNHVLRGGSFNNGRGVCRCSIRDSQFPGDNWMPRWGFRVACYSNN